MSFDDEKNCAFPKIQKNSFPWQNNGNEIELMNTLKKIIDQKAIHANDRIYGILKIIFG